jgi:pilus assembly protein CpaF
MFSKYKKTDAPAAKLAPVAAGNGTKTPDVGAAPEAPRKSMMKSAPVKAVVVPQDKEKKRKERLSDIKLEMHKALLDNLKMRQNKI